MVAAGEQNAARFGGVDVDLGGDLERPAAHVDRDRFGHLECVGVVDVAVPRRAHLRPRRGQYLDRCAVLQRQTEVLTGLEESQIDQLLEQPRVFVREVVHL